jgi:cytochrome c oxidase assembly protein subunit 15
MAVLVIVVWGRALYLRLSSRALAAHYSLLLSLAAQGAIGIATLLLVVPLPLASLHQAGALIVFTLALTAAYFTNQAKLPPAPDIQVLP